MAGGDTRGGERVPRALRIRLKYPDEATFLQKYGANISRGGVFIATRSPRPVGSALRFEFQLADGEPLIRGEGAVAWVKPYDEGHPERPHGMGVRFTQLDEQSRAIVERALEWKEQARRGVQAQEATAGLPEDTRRIAMAAVMAPLSDEPGGAAESLEAGGALARPQMASSLSDDDDDLEIIIGATSSEPLDDDEPLAGDGASAHDGDALGLQTLVSWPAPEGIPMPVAAAEPVAPSTLSPLPSMEIESPEIESPEIEPPFEPVDPLMLDGATITGVGLLGPSPEIVEGEPFVAVTPAPTGAPAFDDDALDRLAAEAHLTPARLDGATVRARALVGALVEKLSGGDGEFDWLLEPSRPEPLPSPSQARTLLVRMLAARERGDSDER